MAKSTAKPTAKGSSTKPAKKGSVYTPPNASTALPASFHKPLRSKGKKKSEVSDD